MTMQSTSALPRPVASDDKDFYRRDLAVVDLPTDTIFWTTAQVAAYCGISRQTLSSYVSRSQAPAPVGKFNGLPLWEAESIKVWHHSRPSQRRLHPQP
ncbi:helix-turn-helix transcriptional regulator [Corynebacterium uberis]